MTLKSALESCFRFVCRNSLRQTPFFIARLKHHVRLFHSLSVGASERFLRPKKALVPLSDALGLELTDDIFASENIPGPTAFRFATAGRSAAQVRLSFMKSLRW